MSDGDGMHGADVSARQNALSVSAAMALAKSSLESVTVRLIGEVSELSDKPGYKAVYFTVKDDKAALPCMMWNNRYSANGVRLSIGALVEITGRFTLYAAKGRMNFDVFSIALAGEGELRMRVADLARRLKLEGLFEPENKIPIPALPEKIGVVTSPRGAAVHDVLRTLRRRFPLAEVLLAGVPVEGARAPEYLIEGLSETSRSGAEVILLVRGGGSFEDLMPFNDERLARAIAACPVPIVTGIGHEPDTSIADMVADLRASTPTAAAEAVSSSASRIAADIDALETRMASAQISRISSLSMMLDRLAASRVFADPMRLFENEAFALDDLSMRLFRALPGRLDSSKAKIREYSIKMHAMLDNAAAKPRSDTELLIQRFANIGDNLIRGFKGKLALASSRLDDLSPLAVIARGYGVVKDEDRKLVSSVEQVKQGDILHISVADGIIDCDVRRTDRIELSLQEI